MPYTGKRPEFEAWQNKVIELLSPKVTNAESFRESHGLYASFNFGTTAEDFANSLLVCIPDGSRAEIHHD